MTNGQTTTVLVVDDDDLVRLPMAVQLQEEGYDVLEAASGSEALELLKAHPEIQVAVIDLNMPSLGGMALMTVVQADWPHLPLVATSGAEPKEPMPDGVLFIAKPHTEGQLIAAVEVSLLSEQFGLK